MMILLPNLENTQNIYLFGLNLLSINFPNDYRNDNYDFSSFESVINLNFTGKRKNNEKRSFNGQSGFAGKY